MAKLTNYLKNFFFILILLQITPILIQSIIKQYTHLLEPRTKVAIISIQGILHDSSTYTKYLKKYFKDKEIKSILLKIDCPGSSAGTGEAIAHEISLLKNEYPKPIISISENICTSGAYYIAASTDYIISAPSTLLGSIGASIPYQFKVNELLEKYDIHYVPVFAGNYKSATDPFSPLTPEKQNMLQSAAESSYKNFIEHVAQNRPKLSLEHEKTWADGKIFSGIQALRLGLIDELGSYSNAVNKIKELAVIEGEIEWIRPTQYTSLWNTFFGQSASESLSSALPGLRQLIKSLLLAQDIVSF